MNSKKWIWIAFAGIMLIAAVIRIDFLLSVRHEVPHDTRYYDEMVRQLLERGIYAYKGTEPNAQVAPGFPLIMAAVYTMVDYTAHDPFVYIRWLNFVLSLITLFVILQIARKVAGNLVGLLTLLMCAFYAPFVWANGAVLTEVPAICMLSIYLYVQLIAFETRKPVHALAAGALLGATALIRPEFLPLCVPLYLFYWLWTRDRHFWKPFIVVLAGIAIVMSPWWIRNVITMDKLILTATQSNPFTAGTYPNKNYEDGLVDRNNKTQKQIAIERLKVGFTEHTWTFVKWYTVGKLRYTYGDMFLGAGHEPLYKPMPFPALFHRGILLAALIGIIITLRRWRQALTVLAVVIVVMSALRLLFVPEFRYNFTMMPLLIIFTAVTFATLLRWLNNKRKIVSTAS
ncbi:glycosyltransferase family 39 protein [Cohnella kolymensis]|uniref:glycosyltransferase family 39 protein n=1 Tax=Cohnella kolymensis TaxID=1590652 RepID=UPI000698519B|nr:glycosyltransferase family 39 protein [Cohnella kolymensis]